MSHPAEIVAPHRTAPRYCPDRAFPAYQYVPGVHPHPVRDPRGHSYAPPRTATDHNAWDPADWQELTDWLWGVDLFNAFFFWEAHEAWERLWITQPRKSAPALVLQGLIQLAAALLKLRTRSVAAADRLAKAGLEKLTRAASTARAQLGLNLDRTISDFRSYLRPLAERIAPPLDESVPMLVLSSAGGA
jgi:predicted metal-dependent hydrolase